MNSAPAELLHLLVHAALQPSLACPAQQRVAKPKKTPATMPALERRFKKYQAFFEENAALPDRIGRSGVCKSAQSGLLLSIQFGYTLSWPTVFLVPVHID